MPHPGINLLLLSLTPGFYPLSPALLLRNCLFSDNFAALIKIYACRQANLKSTIKNPK
jgi:hypothetical protein